MSELQSLAATLADSADVLARAMDVAGHQMPSLTDQNSAVDLPVLGPEGLSARNTIISTAERIIRLASGPFGLLERYSDTVLEVGVMKILMDLRVPQMIPLNAAISFEELSNKTGISESLVKRLVRLAILSGFLAEDDGRVMHNSVSSIFINDPRAAEGARWGFEVNLKSTTRMSEALSLDSSGQNPRATPFSVAYKNGGELLSLWEILAQNPDLDQGFHALMVTCPSLSLYSLQHILHAYDWAKISSLVDVGGSTGHASQVISSSFPHIKCTVQDREEATGMGMHHKNISFMEHDFFQPQPLQADAYLYRWIFHDWSDADAQ